MGIWITRGKKLRLWGKSDGTVLTKEEPITEQDFISYPWLKETLEKEKDVWHSDPYQFRYPQNSK